MRFLSKLLLSSLLIFTAGCSAPKDISYLAPAPDATLGSYQPGSPVETRTDAIIVAGKLFEERGGIKWIESPRTIFTEEMSYAEAEERIGVGDAQYDVWPPETKVWLVVFKGQWQLIPLDPTQADPLPLGYEGCVFSLFTVRDGELINANPQNPEEKHQVFLLKKQVEDAVLVEARVDENREIHIKFRTDFLSQIEQT